MKQDPLLVVLGPTASGKTRLAVRLAQALNGELISADSRQVFKGMDIGTGKDLSEYTINETSIPYHLINIKEPGEKYNVNAFKEDFYTCFNSLTSQNILPVLCGGTGMYIHSILLEHEFTTIPVNEPLREKLLQQDIEELRALLDSYPAQLTAHADRSSFKRLVRAVEIAEYLKYNELDAPQRPSFEPFIVGLHSDVELRRNRIIQRMETRFEEGMIEEVQRLLVQGVSKEILTFYGLEYKFIVSYLSGELDYNQLKERLAIAICQFAKRQMTFFRKMEKDGVDIHWFNSDQPAMELFSEVFVAYQQSRIITA